MRAFDLGVTHFDLANNYGGRSLDSSDDRWAGSTGPPYGAAEANLGEILRQDLRPYRDELIISTKAGCDMWPGPYGDRGSRKYLLASWTSRWAGWAWTTSTSSTPTGSTRTPRSRRPWAPSTPRCRSGRALYAGISSYSAERTAEAAAILRELGTPLLIHQPSYSMLNRWIEGGLLDVLGGRARLHRVLAARAGPADRQVPERGPGRLAGHRERGAGPGPAHRTEPRPRPRSQRDRRARGQSLAQLALSWACATRG